MPPDSTEKNKREDDARPRKDKTRKDDNEAIQPTQEKIPEGHGNLRRRADWFQKRSGETP